MSLGGFAEKTFEVNSNKIYTFDDYSNSFGISIEEQEVENDRPSNYIKGLDLEKPSFTIDLRQSSSVDVETELKEWKEICYSKTPHMLFIGNTPVSDNKYILEKGNISDSLVTNSGKMIKCKLKLTFREHVRYGAKKKKGHHLKLRKVRVHLKKKSSSSSSDNTMSSDDEAKVLALESQIFGG
ncbi:hypothetical protein AK964_18905 [Clostridium butyricum]|nr:hypothetical protein AK964_18905 [Clostridium butyricum]